jgi:type VI protein secretion system component Hcp
MSTRLTGLVLASAALAAGAAPALADGPSFKAFAFAHKVDKASPVLMQAAAPHRAYRGRYQLRLDEAQGVLSGSKSPAAT